MNPVLIAVYNDHVDGVRALLEHNANPNQAMTDDGATSLRAAAQRGMLFAAHLLVAHGADIAAGAFC